MSNGTSTTPYPTRPAWSIDPLTGDRVRLIRYPYPMKLGIMASLFGTKAR